MRYLKHINEEFENEFSGSDASAVLLDYDAFVLNGASTKEDEDVDDETEELRIDNGTVKRTQIG